MMLLFHYFGPQHSPDAEKRLRKSAEDAMKRHGKLSSQSGVTAAYAIRWCEENGKPFTVKCGPNREYYYVEADA